MFLGSPPGFGKGALPGSTVSEDVQKPLDWRHVVWPGVPGLDTVAEPVGARGRAWLVCECVREPGGVGPLAVGVGCVASADLLGQVFGEVADTAVTLVAGPAEHFTDQQIQQMAAAASEQLADVPPITASLGKILYHPEAIMLAVAPAADLAPIRAAAMTATEAVTGSTTGDETPWTPHITLCYSTTEQPAQPVITALGKQLATCQVDIGAVSLVIQNGPERDWNWTTVATVRLRTTALA